MNGVKTASHMSTFLRHFSKLNRMRPTRMGVFEEGGNATVDYWLEDNLPLTGVDLETHDGGKVSIQILLSNKSGAEKSHFSHMVADVRQVKIVLSNNCQTDGLEISGLNGNTTVLRFEDTRP